MADDDVVWVSHRGNGRHGHGTGAFRSVLFDDMEAGADVERRAQPVFFGDLNLDQVVDAVIAQKASYNLAPFFYAPLVDPHRIRFRQEIFADLERPEVLELARAFAKQELVARYERQRREMSQSDWAFAHYHHARTFLNAAIEYCDAVERLAGGLDEVGVSAAGLLGLLDYLAGYVGGEQFRSLCDEARVLDDELDGVRYSFVLDGSRITVGPYDELPDYSAQVAETFARFRQGAVTSYLPESKDWDTYASIGVLYLVAKVYPELFGRLDAFCARYAEYLDHTVAVLDRELQFYLSYLDYIEPLREAGLAFSYPRVSADEKAEQVSGTFDLALAAQLNRDGAAVVCNDIRLDGPERILVVTGPNNGGKTTLARTIGQLHYLARLGCPIPGHDSRLFVCDEIFTHFERREDIETLVGKLRSELDRMHEALEAGTPSSLFILNEMFNSTTAQDALFLSREILGRLSELDALCVCVTFLDELATFDEKTASVVATVDASDPAIRTYRLVRRPADGRAYARALAEKYGLTYERLRQRERP